MARIPGPPPLDGLKRRIEQSRQARPAQENGHFVRETFRLERGAAREKAREWFDTWPKACDILADAGHDFEYYETDGSDIAAACGQLHHRYEVRANG